VKKKKDPWQGTKKRHDISPPRELNLVGGRAYEAHARLPLRDSTGFTPDFPRARKV